MSDRIDYLNNAAERIRMAITSPQVENEVPALVLAQIATAEATLALAEQQRIANRIALASAVAEASRAAGMHGSVIGLMVKNVGLFRDPSSPDGVPPLHDDIREGLGLS